MYKILIADDEPRHRRGIIGIIQKIRPTYTLFEARDGDEALRIVNSNDIDIIITDIKMPNVDGLQLIERLGSKIKTIKIVILSAYGYFDYAKKAISFGAFEYTLKPVEKGDIEKIIYKLEESIERDQKLLLERINIEKRLRHTMPVYLEHLFTKWVCDGLSKVEYEEIEKLFPQLCEYAVVISEVSQKDVIGSHNIASETIEMTLKFCLQENFKHLGDATSFFLGSKKNTLVSIISTDKDSFLGNSKLKVCAESFLLQMKSEYGFEVTVAISNTFNHIFNDIKISYEQSIEALLYKFYYGPGSIIFYNKIPFNQTGKPLTKHSEEDSMSNAIIQLNREDVMRIIDGLLKRVAADGYHSPHLLKETMINFAVKQIKRLEHLLLKDQLNMLIELAESVLSTCEYIDDLQLKLKEIFISVITDIETQKRNKNSAIIQKCKEYIEKNYMDDIPLDSISNKFHFSPAYFSSFFKNYTGIGFSEFILQTRIRKAKELLINTDERIYDIAFKVGYKDPGYFTKIFKREIGLSPEEFRRKIENSENG